MRGHGSTTHQHGTATTTMKVALLFVGALIFSLAFTFLHQHHHISNAMTGMHKLELSAGAWEEVFSLARQSRHTEEFMALVQSRGMLETSQSAGGQSAYEQPCKCPEVQQQTACPAQKPCPICETSTPVSCAPCPVCASLAPGSEPLQVQAEQLPAEELAFQESVKKDSTQFTYPRGAWRQHIKEDKEAPMLTTALARSVAINNTVIVTWANNALYDFVLSVSDGDGLLAMPAAPAGYGTGML
jgi:hypothetical protein